jgi:hypothetical protein
VTRLPIAAAAITLGLAAASGAVADEPTAPAKLIAESSAIAVSGKIEIGSQSVPIKPQLEAKGSAPPAYDVTNSKKSYHNTLDLPYATLLSVRVGTTTDRAASTGQQGSTATATASSSIEAASVMVTNPTIPGLLVLEASATKVASIAKFTNSNTARPSGSGAVSLTGLRVDLSGFGFGVVPYPGTTRPRPNTRLFESPNGTIIVYLNRQITTLGTALSGPDKLVPTSIEVDAVDVHLTDALVHSDEGDYTVSGDLFIAASSAE